MRGDGTKGQATVLFVGADASGSRALTLVPAWASSVGLSLTVEPVDVPVGAPPGAFGGIVEALATGDRLGAVVTDHKVGMFQAVRGRCIQVSPDADTLGECSVLVSRRTGLAAYATDVGSVGEVADDLLQASSTAAPVVVCLGAGGAGAALCLHLLAQPSRSLLRRIVVCERDEVRAGEFLRVFESITDRAPEVDLVVEVGEGPWDQVVASAAAGSLVVNATGLGKTSGGSPVTDEVCFPIGATVWDLNYRGPLQFLHQAREQAAERQLGVHDGTSLFATGWLAALRALGIHPGDQDVERFVAMAREPAA
jgi:shikimate 5-dehydrogenase